MVTTHYTVTFDGNLYDRKFDSIEEISVFAETHYMKDLCSSYVINGHDTYSKDDKTPEYGRTYFWRCSFRK